MNKRNVVKQIFPKKDFCSSIPYFNIKKEDATILVYGPNYTLQNKYFTTKIATAF